MRVITKEHLAAARKLGWGIVKVSSRPGYYVCRHFDCNTTRELYVGNIRKGLVKCQTCLDNTYREHTPAGWKYIGNY